MNVSSVFAANRLGRVARVIDPQPDHRAPALAEDSGFPYVGIRDIQSDGSLDLEGARRVDEAALLKQERAFRIERGDIVFGRVATLGNPRLIQSEGRFALSATLALIKPHAIDAHFLFYCLSSMVTQRQIDLVSTGSTRQAIGIQQLRRFLVPVPPPHIQLKIVRHLGRETAHIDQLIAARRKMMGLLAEREGALIEGYARDSGWRHVPLGRLIRRIEQGWSPQSEARVPQGNEWGILKVNCVNQGQYQADELKALPSDVVPRAAYTVRDGDFLISRANTRKFVGSAAIVRDVWPRTLLCDKLYRVLLDDRKVLTSFICLWLQTRAARDQIELEATGASDSMQNIGQDTVRQIRVPLPGLGGQRAFVVRCEQEGRRIRDLMRSSQRQIELLQERRQALVTAAITGQLDIPETA